MKANHVKKITVGDILGNTITGFRDGKIKPGVVLRVLGNVIGCEPKENQYGLSYKMTGNFEATNPADGAVYASSVCYLPEVVSLPVAAQLSSGVKNVAFAIDLILQKDEKSPVGFSYAARSLVDDIAVDPFAELRADLPPLLEAPKEEKKKK